MIGERGSAMILLLPGTTDRVAIAWVVSRKTLVKPVSGRESAARLLCSLDCFKTIGEGTIQMPGVRAANTA